MKQNCKEGTKEKGQRECGQKVQKKEAQKRDINWEGIKEKMQDRKSWSKKYKLYL